MFPELESLFKDTYGTAIDSIDPLPIDGSARRRWRLRAAGRTVIGTHGEEPAENRAFIALSRHFRAARLPVPEIVAISPNGTDYLEEDLGDTTLFKVLVADRSANVGQVTPRVRDAYLSSVRTLLHIQVEGARGLDWSVCFPRSVFDRQSMFWDLNYFKYYFLRLAKVPHHEQQLEDDFEQLVRWLESVPAETFLYRDFQSRNIMLRDGRPWFIDFQGGRRGALAYDLASLTLDAKADLPFDFRAELVEAYISELSKLRPVDPARFREELQAFSLIRILQAMGAYGFRGFYERKEHFLQSVPYALRNLERLLSQWSVPLQLPALFDALGRLAQSAKLRELAPPRVPLHVSVTSFSYKKGLPVDTSGHGGGFVFDCRLLPNPGREDAYKPLTGRDKPVITYLDGIDEVHSFLETTRTLVRSSVVSYQKRNFSHLSVAFGCTGGQHRSVYCAERFAAWLRTLPNVTSEVRHRELDPS